MPRKRKPEDMWLPDRVYRHPRGFVLIPKGSGRTILLCPIDADKLQVWERYRDEVATLSKRDTIEALFQSYFSSPEFSGKAARTRRDNLAESARLLQVFGQMLPAKVEPHHVRRYMDLRGEASRTQANHELALFSVVFSWGYERGLVTRNPCKGVKKFTVKSRERYVTDSEYAALYSCAQPALKVIMEITYRCAARVGDVIKMRYSQVTPDGIYIKQGKTGKQQVKAWNDELRTAVELARSLGDGAASQYVACQADGQPYTYDGIYSAWRRAKAAAKQLHPAANFEFTIHDLKAKGISDFDGTTAEKQDFSGHKTMAQVAIYDRKPRVVKTVSKKIGKG